MKNIRTLICLILAIVLTVTACTAAGVWFVRSRQYESADNGLYPVPELSAPLIESGSVSVDFRTSGKYFYKLDEQNSLYSFTYLKGVNIGLTQATTSLDNPDVSYDTYREWFAGISEMNANTVKVFTVMPPQFYSALYDHNSACDTPLYLLQGIWFDESYMETYDNAYDGDGIILDSFVRAAKETVDIVHGKSDYTTYGTTVNAVYNRDVSPYLAGYIMGLEWEPGFVSRTNEIRGKSGYKGKYIYTSDWANSFETFLCRAGNSLIEYETQTYSAQTPLAFLNWATTDALTHTNEPFAEEDLVSVNTENILSSQNYFPGLFAAVDAYSYYPEFMNYQPEYLSADSSNYKAYIDELNSFYSVPLVIAEVGLPTSRGTAHTAASGYNQGGLTEYQQGEMLSSLLEDIAGAGSAGSMIFSWQDEWFKQTWNTVKYSADNPLFRTPNIQSAEQSYGILAMEPGENAVCVIDGKADEWHGTSAVQGENCSVSFKWDASCLYALISSADFDYMNDTLYVPIKISGLGSRDCQQKNIAFSDNTDFLLQINGQNNTRIMVDTYENVFYYIYSVQKGVFPAKSQPTGQQSGVFDNINQFLSNEINLPLTGETIDPKYYESGLLKYGIGDPDSAEYNSQADFYAGDGFVEVRIPWYILNVMNANTGVCLNDFQSAGEVGFGSFSSISAGIGRQNETIALSDIGYAPPNSEVKFRTRLKQSYAALQKTYKTLMSF